MKHVEDILTSFELHLFYMFNRIYFVLFDRFSFKKIKIFNRIWDPCYRLIRVINTCSIMNNKKLEESISIRWEKIFFLICASLGFNYKTAEMLYNNGYIFENPKNLGTIDTFKNKLERYSRYWNLNRLMDLHCTFAYAMKLATV